jgi:hypothetical protein
MTTKIFDRFTNLAKRDFRGTAELFKMLNAQKNPPPHSLSNLHALLQQQQLSMFSLYCDYLQAQTQSQIVSGILASTDK